jgi:hypothetical protein
MAARLEYPNDGFPELDSRHVVVPTLFHELQPVGRIGDHGVDRVDLELCENF